MNEHFETLSQVGRVETLGATGIGAISLVEPHGLLKRDVQSAVIRCSASGPRPLRASHITSRRKER